MNTIFMNTKNRKTPHPYRLLTNLTDKIDLRRGKKSLALSNFSIYHNVEKHKKLRKQE